MTECVGVILGLVSAVAASGSQVLAKKLGDRDPFVVSLMRFLPSIPFLAALVYFFGSFEVPEPEYWLIVIFILAPLEVVLSYLFVRAAALAPLSVAAPLLALSGVILLPAGYVFLGEMPTPLGILGVLVTLLGAFLVSANGDRKLRFEPELFLSNRGCQFALVGSLLAAGLVVLSKFAFRYATPIQSAFYVGLFMSLYLLTIVIVRAKYIRHPREEIPAAPLMLPAIGLTQAIVQLTHYVGLSYLPAAYFISIKRFSMVLSVVLGGHLFNESQMRVRLLGAVVMLLGIILIAVASL